MENITCHIDNKFVWKVWLRKKRGTGLLKAPISMRQRLPTQRCGRATQLGSAFGGDQTHRLTIWDSAQTDALVTNKLEFNLFFGLIRQYKVENNRRHIYSILLFWIVINYVQNYNGCRHIPLPFMVDIGVSQREVGLIYPLSAHRLKEEAYVAYYLR
jgi:hypothetical protein